MSDATTLIRKALDAGIELQFVGGQLKVTGKRKAVECWASKLRENKAALIEALQPRAPSLDWREADRVYQLHHIGCATCVAAGRGYGLRCGTGTALWAAYTAAAP
ncbi:MAG: hypothetical protein J0H16_07360 [Alicycliphilus denitrificans]|nr:hypothetical protein [Alicycliphilus denitrificans]